MNVTLTKRENRARIGAGRDALANPDRFLRRQSEQLRLVPWHRTTPLVWRRINWVAVLDGAAFLFAAVVLVFMALAALAQ